MLIPSHLVETYSEMLQSIDSELIILDDRIYIDTLSGRIEIDKDGFIDHFNFKRGAEFEEQIINFSVLLANKISHFPRSIHAIF